MKTKRHLVIPATLCVVVLAVTIVSAENQAVTRPEPAATKAPATQAAVEPEATGYPRAYGRIPGEDPAVQREHQV